MTLAVNNLVIPRLDAFTRAYIGAALQLADEEVGADATIENLAPETLETIKRECFQFVNQASSVDLLDDAANPLLLGNSEQSGTDFFLSRNGHGAGFFDKPEYYGEEECNNLQSLAEEFGTADLYVGDGNLVYQC